MSRILVQSFLSELARWLHKNADNPLQQARVKHITQGQDGAKKCRRTFELGHEMEPSPVAALPAKGGGLISEIGTAPD